ncbi:VanZ family protein [Actinocorallia sp. A-T 12471]|uniref:VanZ family protein n=1 Tax=Actinocorallia sp. A-T 12471 TaxID=3089813 RepID=UPI0029CC0527|nr:VanZ family protein [Actinocorallia sp. A-T 12471]MDX6739685.1 VanZ family protein [Actinocorallia sp. A-T 12471]
MSGETVKTGRFGRPTWFVRSEPPKAAPEPPAEGGRRNWLRRRTPKETPPQAPPQKPRKKSRGLLSRFFRFLTGVVTLAALAVFSYWAYRFTLTPVPDPNGWAIGNGEPGKTLRFYLDRPSIKEAVHAIGGNLILLAPLGVMLPILFKSLRGPLRLTVVGAFLSFCIEIVQHYAINGRTFDVDDIILNATGVLLAYLLLGQRAARLIHGRKPPLTDRLLGRA